MEDTLQRDNAVVVVVVASGSQRAFGTASSHGTSIIIRPTAPFSKVPLIVIGAGHVCVVLVPY
jgi:hypothetical protein